MIANKRFRFRPILTIWAVIGLAVLVSLGSWQLHRLEWKNALIDKVEARVDAPPIAFAEAVARAAAGEDMEYAPVRVTGRARLERPAKVFGSYEARPGHFFFAPVATGDGAHVYVNLGFTPQALERPPDLTAVLPADEARSFTGLLRKAEIPAPPASWFRPRAQSADGFWFVRDPLLFAAEAGLQTPAYYIDSFAIEGVDWPKGGTTRLQFNNRHLEYALTWFGLAAALFGVWVAFSLRD
ncbi:MAG: SURF1 family protein [Hyphococcus sp.]